MHQSGVTDSSKLSFGLTGSQEAFGERSRAPVFVMGCHRSGTNLLYDMLLSAGGFAVYRGYLPIYKMLIPKFGALDSESNRRRILDTWLRSKGFRRSGLEASQLRTKIVQGCRTGGDFIRIIMEEIAQAQNVKRWAVYDPDNVLYVPQIKREISNALFVHIIRDGRDVAFSLKKMGGYRPLPWGGSRGLRATTLYWEWMVQKGRQYGRSIPLDYIEVRYEDLMLKPHTTLQSLGEFLAHDLNYDRIRSRALGRLTESNSSFLDEAQESSVPPMDRWKQRLTRTQVAGMEALVGDTLQQSGYALTTRAASSRSAIRHHMLRAFYRNFLEAKLWLKLNTPMGRLANLSALELSDASQGR